MILHASDASRTDSQRTWLSVAPELVLFMLVSSQCRCMHKEKLSRLTFSMSACISLFSALQARYHQPAKRRRCLLVPIKGLHDDLNGIRQTTQCPGAS